MRMLVITLAVVAAVTLHAEENRSDLTHKACCHKTLQKPFDNWAIHILQKDADIKIHEANISIQKLLEQMITTNKHPETAGFLAETRNLAREKDAPDKELVLGCLNWLAEDYKTAINWFDESAGNGSASAHFFLGNIHLFGIRTGKDRKAAITHLEKAAEAGDKTAQYQLANIYLAESSSLYDVGKGARLMKQAAANGHKDAAFYLAQHHMQKGARKEIRYPPEAVKYLEQAAELGHPEACRELGSMHYTSHQTPLALKWFRMGAELEDGESLFMLGIIYYNKCYYDKSLEYWKKGAMADHKNCQVSLAGLYHRGEGTPQDLVLAETWYTIGESDERPVNSEIGYNISKEQQEQAKKKTSEYRTLIYKRAHEEKNNSTSETAPVKAE